MSEREKNFFNELAERWDDLRAADDSKVAGLVRMAGLKPGNAVLDVGCGTGVLLPHLLATVGETGKITAIDFAENMVDRARAKVGRRDNVTFVVGDIWSFWPECVYDSVFCFNFFPHAVDKPAFVARVLDLLKEGGSLVIMHDMSRAAVNAIHQGSRVVTEDRLPEGTSVAHMLLEAGYEVQRVIDDEEKYFVKAMKPTRRG
jgi:ubiquinone/menaquinone biosynthesis C-methylase UbiE